MKKQTRTLGVVLIFLAVMYANVIAYAQAELMPAGEVQAGMKGIGKTVITGTVIENFDVEILGIVKGQSPAGDLFLCRVSGPIIDRSGGIAAGMSGSPVFIDGKLVGAIGYSWSLTDHRLGMITPIETMLRILTTDQNRTDPARKIIPKEQAADDPHTTSFVPADSTARLTEPVLLGERIITQIQFAGSLNEAASQKQDAESLIAYPVRTPLFVSGLSGRALDRFMKDLNRFDLVPISAGAGTADDPETERAPEPGSAVTAQLVRGDVDVSAVGTLTYRDGNSFVAFGHPFLSLGAVEYFLSDAEIVAVVDNLDMPFKLGVAGKPQGVVTQDRNAGIGGYLDRMPTIVPVSITVHDLDMDLTREIAFQVVRDEELLTSLTVNAALQAVDTVMDRQGYGTSSIEIEVLGDKLPDHLIRYSNMYYSPDDIAGASLGDLYSLLQMIASNPFEHVNVANISVTLDVMKTRQFAIVEEVKILNSEVRPGDQVQLAVTLRPYRGKPFTQTLEISLPENIQPGTASLMVSGGLYGAYERMDDGSDQTNQSSGEEMSVVGEHFKSLNEVLQAYLKQPRNHELVVDILQYPGDMEGMELNLKEDIDETDSTQKTIKVAAVKSDKDREQPADTADTEITDSVTFHRTFGTEYVLEGSLQLELTILEPLPQEENGYEPSEDDPVSGNQVNNGD